MSDGGAGLPQQSPAVYTIPLNRSFADALAAGLIARFGPDPLSLAAGRIILPNNRAARSVRDAFVRASGSGLLLPRLIPIGDPDIDESIGAALDSADRGDPVPPAIEPIDRLCLIATAIRQQGESSSEAFRLAADFARTLDSLTIEEIHPAALVDAAADAGDLADHWNVALARLRQLLGAWPQLLADRGRIDLTDRRNRLLRAVADLWKDRPPAGFTVAAGINTSAPAVVALLARIARMPDGMVVLAGLNHAALMSDTEWEALGPGDGGTEESHPQFHLKLLLDRIGVARQEVRVWPRKGQAASSPLRGRAVVNAMVAARFSDKWQPHVKGEAGSGLPSSSRRLSGVRLAELPDQAAEAQAIAIALREVIETEGKTAALVTPDRALATRVSALLRRWDIEADDSAGMPLVKDPAATLLLGICSAAAEELAPVPLLALLKHPLVGGKDKDRIDWLDDVRKLDLALRGPRPAAGLDGLDRHFAAKDGEAKFRGCGAAWERLRPAVLPIADLLRERRPLPAFAQGIADVAGSVTDGQAWVGPGGRASAELLQKLSSGRQLALDVGRDDALPLLRQLLDSVVLRPPYGGHSRIFIWGLLEARLQQADLMILGGLNEGVWPAQPSPDPWLAPKIRANLGLPGQEFRIGLAAHDFAGALGASEVLITRSRRDGRSPTVASRFLLRLEAMTGGLPRDYRLEGLVQAIDRPESIEPARRPAPVPPLESRPRRISVTSVDRMKADPFAFYAQSVLGLRTLDPADADHSAAWKGTAVHKVLEQWLLEDDCDPDALIGRTERFLAGEAIHPMLRALWAPRLEEAIHWIVDEERSNRSAGRSPLAAEKSGSAEVAGVVLEGKADRIDRLAGGGMAILDYKTGNPPPKKMIEAGFALQLGLLGLIATRGGFAGIDGAPGSHEYWSLAKHSGRFGRVVKADAALGAQAFIDAAEAHFRQAAERWLTGDEPFTAKLNPAFAPYGDYDQLMRLEEWYGRR